MKFIVLELEGLISQICHVQNRIALRNHLQNNQRASVVWVDHDSEEDELTCDQMEEEFQQKVADFVNLFSENDMKVSEFFNENFHSAVKRLNGIRKYIAYYPKEEQDENSLQEAIIETYRMFLLLKNYASINFSAFHEILKNYDRRTGRMISPWFMISQSHSSKSLLTQAKGIQNFIGDIENLYANRFYKGYGSLIKARRDLLRRRQPHHMRNDQTYSIGFHSGFCVPLAGFSWAFVTLAFETRRINYMFIMNLNPKSVIRLHEILTSGFFLVAIWLSSAYL
ncbi:hypothetical protein SARC_08822 [Sphaeroforma arctica JP610]|uniref:SPX domain-containing protein n=1 Tax=Sphaeroforma arctica JP610 TaxID=667725 RepID=A0A0L0FS15_9EUKA|nr:hypothetical protein SARC_08822 [Sphaeroforma arctica JP610]KNC78758.1 hypothetical protein SARC_08822 [Sphaeroforma arctica JP610]|eukprot:XP_014152660.1 hypothetical protein SARC_08822 [Sphaeroforma arctica JP610]